MNIWKWGDKIWIYENKVTKYEFLKKVTKYEFMRIRWQNMNFWKWGDKIWIYENLCFLLFAKGKHVIINRND